MNTEVSTQEQAPIEECEQTENAYYCGTCRSFIPIETPCVHLPSNK
jgi:hypothetical protein